MNFKEIEKAGFRSWPAFEELEEDGVVLRFSNGYSKRANSANVLSKQKSGFGGLVSRYEDYYRSKGLPCVIRIPSFTNNEKLDNYLNEEGYEHTDHSLVLYRSIENITFENPAFENLKFSIVDSHDWILSYCKINEIDFIEHATHLEMIDRIRDNILLVVLIENGIEIACGLGVISRGLFGLFDITVTKSKRNKGYGTELIKGMLRWAVENGASNSYLQVIANNRSAINLYEKLGYKFAYDYWYRISRALI